MRMGGGLFARAIQDRITNMKRPPVKIGVREMQQAQNRSAGAKARVRIAPSPTGPIHVGTIHTALFNWLFARSTGSTFIVRLEDTDQERSKPEWETAIYEEMRWLNLDWDEGPDIGGPYGPYRQMERLPLYREYADRLLASGHAYPCYCTAEELDAERKAAQARGEAPMYGRRCRNLSPAERERLEAEGRRPVLRFKAPETGVIAFDDIIRGRIETPASTVGDFVIMRANGIPLYNFAVVVDDITMAITHVIRGDDHISNTPKQILIYQALKAPLPAIGHLGNILGTDRKKLSKRNGDAYVGDFRDQGYLPEAMINFLSLLGWSPPSGEELVPLSQIIEQFTLDRVIKSPSVFDVQKLDWLNGAYIRRTPLPELVQLCLPFLQRAGHVSAEPGPEELSRVERIVALEQERIKRLAEIVNSTDFFFTDEIQYDPKSVEKVLKSDAAAILSDMAQRLAGLATWDATAIEAEARACVADRGVKVNDVFQPLRVAVTGRTVSPPLPQTMEILGREVCLRRIKAAQTLCGVSV